MPIMSNMTTDKNTTRLTIELDSDIKRRFNGKSAYEGKTMKEKVLELINEYLRQPDKV